MLDDRRSPSPLAARGSLFHKWHHQALNLMRENQERILHPDQGIELLVEVLMQRNVPADEVIPISMKEMRWLRVLVVKWCLTMELSIERLVDVERRLFADLTLPDGTIKKITGQLDTLFSGPGLNEALSIDAKTGYARPKEPRSENPSAEQSLTELGWVQSLVYAFLVFRNFASVDVFTFREWHVLWGESREARIERWEAERMEDVLAAQVALLDQAVREGPESERWVASAGPHCAMCARPRDCPIREQVGIPSDEQEARRLAQEWIVAGKVREERRPLIQGWVDAHGPVEVPYSGGRRVVGWDISGEGKRRFAMYEPKPMLSPYDDQLVEAARERGALVEAM